MTNPQCDLYLRAAQSHFSQYAAFDRQLEYAKAQVALDQMGTAISYARGACGPTRDVENYSKVHDAAALELADDRRRYGQTLGLPPE